MYKELIEIIDNRIDEILDAHQHISPPEIPLEDILDEIQKDPYLIDYGLKLMFAIEKVLSEDNIELNKEHTQLLAHLLVVWMPSLRRKPNGR